MSTPAMKQDTPEIRLVVFDLGRVLIRICNNWMEAAQRARVDAPFEALDAAAMAALHKIVCQSEIGKMDPEGFVAAASPILRLSPAQVRAMSDAYTIAPFTGGAELVEELTAAGLAVACLSNTNESHWRIMNDPGETSYLPLHRLTHRFASHLVGARKPEAAIYEHVERETRMSPKAILFFDDLPENVEAAIQRGWNTFHVNPKSENPIPAIRSELIRRRVLHK